jgi:hypothetical protein
METVKRRQHGSTYKGHTIPYGTLVGASDELKKVYYTTVIYVMKIYPRYRAHRLRGSTLTPRKRHTRKRWLELLTKYWTH